MAIDSRFMPGVLLLWLLNARRADRPAGW